MGLFNRKKKEDPYSYFLNKDKPVVPKKEIPGENLDEDIQKIEEAERKTYLMELLFNTNYPRIKNNCLKHLYRGEKLTVDEAKKIEELAGDTSYVESVVTLIMDRCDEWKDVISVKCIKSLGDILTSSYSGISLYQKQKVSKLLLKIFDEGLFKEEIRKYNGTVISNGFDNELTDDDNYGMGRFDVITFWTKG